ncbi:MAG: glycosyltransferase family 4 protein [Actinomycetota bacterium]|nr:glycosyltransferase family 4 protein [Actinomycetota bacterium]
MKILHAPSNIANQSWAIAEGLRALGHEVEVWHYGPNKFDFPVDRAVPFPPERPGDLWKLVDEALERFDVFHFHYARSLIPRQVGSIPGLWDLPLYRSENKPVFFTFHGSDVRLRSKHVARERWSYFKYADVPCDEDDIRKRLAIIRTYASRLFVCSPVNETWVPDARFHPRALLVAQWPFVGQRNRDVPVVAHVPSRRSTKGTDVVLKAVEQAQSAGASFEFRLIENLPHAEVRAAMEEADILVDNLLLGDYEVTGLEAMCLGKTVIARLDDAVEKTMGPVPVLNANPDTFAGVLARAIGDADLRKQLGEQAREFVEKNHDATVVARRILPEYENPAGTPPTSFPDWAALSSARREERLEEMIVELRTALASHGKEVVVAGTRRGPFTRLGAKIDALLRRLLGRAR